MLSRKMIEFARLKFLEVPDVMMKAESWAQQAAAAGVTIESRIFPESFIKEGLRGWSPAYLMSRLKSLEEVGSFKCCPRLDNWILEFHRISSK